MSPHIAKPPSQVDTINVILQQNKYQESDVILQQNKYPRKITFHYKTQNAIQSNQHYLLEDLVIQYTTILTEAQMARSN